MIIMEEAETSDTKSEWQDPSVWLPPCRICGEKASGFHYGVNTCEACKGFFRRSIRREKSYKCVTEMKNCEIVPGKRSICSLCRYQKCLSIGMSKEAIKTGRYTYEKKTQNINEVRMLKDQANKLPDDTDFSDNELLLLIESLTISHSETVCYFPDEERERLQMECLERHQLKTELFGSLGPISLADYKDLYLATGIDVDDREQLMKLFAENMDIAIRRLITFAKSIPGFSNLHLDDQANLVKAARFEVGILIFHKHINTDYGIFTHLYLKKTTHIDDMAKIVQREFLDSVMKMTVALKKCTFGLEEIALLRGIVLTFADRCELHDREQVEKIQWKLVCCLKYLAEKNRPRDNCFLARVFQIFCSFRNLTEMHDKFAQMIKLEWPGLQEYPLLLEII